MSITREQIMKIKKDLITKIESFLETYAKISPNFDAEFQEDYEKYTSPDASMIRGSLDQLKLMGYTTQLPFSQYYGSGGYVTTEEGAIIHEEIIAGLKEFLHN